MTVLKKYFKYFAICLVYLAIPSVFSKAAAATFTLTPAARTVNVGDTIDVTVYLDTEGAEIVEAEAVLSYDSAIFEVSSDPTQGSFLATFHTKREANSVAIAGTVDFSAPPAPTTGQGALATVTLTAKAPGTSSFAFVCGNLGSNISGIDPADPTRAVDLLATNCSSLAAASYTVAGPGGVPTATPGGPTPTWFPGGPFETCDRCGRCEGQPIPPRWEDCQACHEQGGKWTVIGCVRTEPGSFVQVLLRIVFSLTGGIAFLALLYGGGLILTSKGNSEQLEKGKNVLRGAIVGILLVFFSVFILQFLGVTVFNLPGFGQ